LNSWGEAIRTKRFRIQALITFISLLGLAVIMPPFFERVIHNKPGVFLDDWILDRLAPRDLSWYIFGLIYSCIFVFILSNYKNPSKILFICSLYSSVTWFRMATIYIFTVEAPIGIIPLNDPFLAFFVYNKPEFVKDLFFSGHVSTLITLALVESKKKIKYLFFFIAAITGLLLLMQHVHYTLDILFAPFFTYLLYVTLKSVTGKMDYPQPKQNLVKFL
jgi:hypothetical protein